MKLEKLKILFKVHLSFHVYHNNVAKRRKKMVKLFKSKKMIAGLIVIALIGGSIYLVSGSAQESEEPQETQTYIRTTTLTKGSIDEVISATGTVSSTNTTAVSSSIQGVKVAQVLVEVGDVVNEGDSVILLEQDQLNEQIADLNEKISDEKEKLQEAYDSALTAKDSAWTIVYGTNGTSSAYESAKMMYDAASGAVSAAQADYDAKLSEYNTALIAVGNAQESYNSAITTGDSALIASANDILTAANSEFSIKDQALQVAQSNLDTVKMTYNFTTLEGTYNQTLNAYETTKSTYLKAEETLGTAQSNLDNQTSTLLESYQDQLSALYETIDDYTLKAESTGTVTKVGATVGSQVSNTTDLVTIDDMNSLKIEVQVSEADIHSIEIGQTANILSDATTEEITGTVTSKSPVASVSGQGSTSSTFTVTVEIDQTGTGLLIGMNAQVDIMLSTIEDVYMVPIDAIEVVDGVSYVYKQISEGNTEDSFERIEVTTGQSNDYYIEVSGAQIQEGLVIRSSAILEDATIESDSMMPNMLDGMSGGEMPSGSGMSGGGQRPAGGQ